MAGQAEDPRTQGEQGKGDGGGGGGNVIQQFPAQKEYEDDGGGIDEGDAEVDAGGGLAEDGHDGGIGGAGARELHGVSLPVRGEAMQDELAGVSIFPLIPFEGHLAQADPDPEHEQDGQADDDPGAAGPENRPPPGGGAFQGVEHRAAAVFPAGCGLTMRFIRE